MSKHYRYYAIFIMNIESIAHGSPEGSVSLMCTKQSQQWCCYTAAVQLQSANGTVFTFLRVCNVNKSEALAVFGETLNSMANISWPSWMTWAVLLPFLNL